MVQFIPARNDWANAFSSIGEGLGSGLTQGYMNRADEKAIQKAITDLGPKASARDVLEALTKTSTYSPKAKQTALENYMGLEKMDILRDQYRAAQTQKQEKKDLDKANAKALVAESDLEDAKKAQLTADIDVDKVGLDAVKSLVKPKKAEPKSDFDKAIARENVKDYKASEQKLIDAKRGLNDLDRIEQLKTKLEGPWGMVKAMNPFNEDASELRSLGYTAIEPIVHIFNPVGPIAQKKLENIMRVFGISPTDTSATIQGKVNALRRYAEATKSLMEKKIKLYAEHKGNPPIGAISEIDAEGQRLTQDMERGGSKERYYSAKNGKEVVPPDEETKKKWIEQGLITNVKP